MSRSPLVLLPGMLCDAELWSHQTSHLGEVAEVRVGDLTRDDSVEGMAISVLEDVPERFSLAGLSMGGIVALEIVRRAPERVERLALLDTTPLPPRPDQLETWRRFAALTEAGRLGDVAEELLPASFHPDRRDEARLRATFLRMAESIGVEAFLRQLRAQASRPDARPSLPAIGCPTLVLVGRQDALCPPGLHAEMAAELPHATLVVVEDCGHMSSIERPQAVTALLRYWILAV